MRKRIYLIPNVGIPLNDAVGVIILRSVQSDWESLKVILIRLPRQSTSLLSHRFHFFTFNLILSNF